MATRETIIKVQLENQDAIRQLGKWEAELVAVRKETTALNKEVRLNDGATAEQERRLGELRSTAKNLSGNIRELSNETSGLTAAGMRFRDKMADATLEAIKQSGVLGQLAARSDTLTKEITDLNASYKAGTITQQQYTAQQEKLQSELGQTTAKMTAMDKKLDELNRDFKEGRITAEKFKAGVQSVNTEVGKGSGAFTKGVTDLKQYALGFVGIVAAAQAVGAVIGSAVTIITDFDQAQSNLAAILNTNKEGIKELTEEAKQYGSITAFTATQVSELQTELAKLGFTQQQISAATPAILDLAAATGTDLANAATIAAQTLNAFQLSAEDTSRVVDIIAQSANLSALDIDTFSAAMSDAAPAAAAVGMSIEDTTAMLSALVDAGIPAEKAGTDLRNIFIKLADSGMTLEEAYAEIKGSQDQLTTSVGLFDQRAAGSALILANNTEKLERLKEGYDGAAGAAARMAETQLDNLRGDQLLLTSAWEGFVLSVEDGSGVIAQSLRALTQASTNLLTSLTNNDFKSFVDQLLGGSGAIMAQAKQQLDATVAQVKEAAKLENQTTQQIEARLVKLRQLRDDFAAQGKMAAAREGDPIIRALQRELDKRKENIVVTKDATDATDANTAATDKNTNSKREQAAALRVLTDDMRAFQAAQKAINEGQGIGMMQGIGQGDLTNNLSRFFGGAGNIGDARPELASVPTPGKDIANDLAGNIEEVEALTTDYQNLFMNMSQSIGESLAGSFEGVEDANKKILISILETVRAAIRIYLAGIFAKEFFTKGFAGIATAAAITVTVEALLAAAINNVQGFASGGMVKQTDGPRYTRNPGDSVLISAAPGEVVMTREQQRRANMAAGFDVFRAARVPGFAVGGVVTRGTALVNSPTAPRPSPDSLSGIRNAFQQAPIFVRVSEINAVQGTVARITERASL
jgi:hypothetical protein